MGTSLNGLLPQNTYSGLIKVGDNTALNTTLKTLSDGAGNDLPMQASTTGINFTGTVAGVASGVSGAIQFSDGSAFASDATKFFWDNTNKRLGIGTNAPTSPLTVIGASQFGNANGIGSVETFDGFYSMSFGKNTSIYNPNSNYTRIFMGSSQTFVDNVSGNFQFRSAGDTVLNLQSGNLAVGNSSTTPTARLQVKGSGSTSATTSLLVQNSSGNTTLIATDDQVIQGYSSGQTRFKLGAVNSGQSVSTRDGEFGVGYIDANNSSGLRFYANGSGSTFIDGWTEGSTKAVNYPLFIGSRVNNTGQGVSGITTAENGTQTIFGYAVNEASSLVTINSTTRGFLPPRMTTTQKNAISSPATGLQVFDSTMNATCEYTGTAWRVVSAGAQAVNVTGLLQTVSLADGNVVNITLNSSTTFTLTNPALGTYILKLTQGTGGGFLVTWPGTVIWSGGTAPTLTTTAGKVDIITLVYDGTNYYGNYSLNY